MVFNLLNIVFVEELVLKLACFLRVVKYILVVLRRLLLFLLCVLGHQEFSINYNENAVGIITLLEQELASNCIHVKEVGSQLVHNPCLGQLVE
jgi:hypothetical protein